MSDVLELSSDSSSDTIIMSPKARENDSDSDVEALVQRYILQNAPQMGEKSVTEECFQHKDNSNLETDVGVPSIKRLKKQSDDDQLKNSSSSSSQEQGSADDNEALQLLHEKYKKNVTSENSKNGSKKSDPNLKKFEKELLKQKKIEDKIQKRKELEKQKELKQALAATSKPTKSADLQKLITVEIDDNITNEPYSNEIISALQEQEVQSKIRTQIFPHMITWSRKTQIHSLADDGNLLFTSKDQDEDQILLIMNCKEFVQHINSNTLSSHIQSIKSVLINKKITLIVYGLQSYTRFLKNQHQADMRRQITDNENPTTSKAFFRDLPKVSTKMMNHALTELQLLCSCSHRLIDTAADLGLLVAQFTKAVAEIPLKLQRIEKFQQTNWFAEGDNRDSVRVDKNGNGLNRLWNQVLTTFPLARLETAEAISAQYPTVTALMTAYETCQSSKEAESLLQDIPIRRAAGPLSSSRKIGPELSKKIHNFFTSLDGETLL